MKKIILILIILVLLISIAPLGLARENRYAKMSSEENLDSNDSESDNNDVDENEEDNEETEVDEENETEDSDEREGVEIGGKSRAMMKLDKVSEVALENIKKARENYLEARERYDEAKEKKEEIKDEIKRLKEKLKDCVNDSSAECNAVRDEARNKTEEFLGNSADAIINALERVKARIQESDRFTEEEKNEMISSIDAKIKEIQDAKESIENVVTGQEIKEAAKKINAAWKNTKDDLNKYSYKTIVARLGSVVDKFDKVSNKLDDMIKQVAENGIDVNELNMLKTNYDNKVKEAIDKLNETSEAVESNNYDIAKGSFNETKDILKEANEILKELIKKIKETKKVSNVELGE